jgi:hypothetical protein
MGFALTWTVANFTSLIARLTFSNQTLIIAILAQTGFDHAPSLKFFSNTVEPLSYGIEGTQNFSRKKGVSVTKRFDCII